MLLKLNKKIEYALITLQFLDDLKDEKYATARQICDEFNIPFDTTSKVMQLMNNHEILTSQQGIKGGYKLNISLNKISYYDLFELIEGKDIKNNCVDLNCSLASTCNISGPITNLNTVISSFFKQLNLADLLNSKIDIENMKAQ